MTIKYILQGDQHSLGDFSVRRILPAQEQMMVGPWIFFDHMGPADFSAGKGIDVRPHPHVNLATVTYLFEGEIFHRDSLGNAQAIQPGAVNLMVAGSGITHSERERPEVRDASHRLNGLQLWHALPEQEEETDPAFYHYAGDEIPQTAINGVPVRVLMGNAYDLHSPVKTFADTLYCEAKLAPGDKLMTPPAEQLAIYVVSGAIMLDGQSIPQQTMVILEDNTTIELTADETSQIAMIGGDILGERFIEWNFVSSRYDRIQQAKQDWLAGRFPLVVGDEDEYIPLGLNAMKVVSINRCSCGSGLDYQVCCELIIQDPSKAETPEQLMRSRYTAYTQNNLQHIKKTMTGNALMQYERDIKSGWAEPTEWLKLVVHSSRALKKRGYVDFTVTYVRNGLKLTMHEKSVFKKIDGRWFYTDRED